MRWGDVARILVASLLFAGHVGVLAALATELSGRGHDIVAYTGAKYRERFLAAGAAWLPFSRAADFDDADLGATFPRIGNGKGFRADRANLEDRVACRAAVDRAARRIQLTALHGVGAGAGTPARHPVRP
jgi:UDP:flavonoid glycosyltransferase YjiC (YdhE family)